MPCFNPIKAYRSGKGGELFFWRKAGTNEEINVPCGQCIGCRLEKSRKWAARIMHEAQMHNFNSFVTLTYSDNPVSLNYTDFQLFMKRLRKRFPGARFYMCGEYGEQLERPHYHAILFGVHFIDRVKHGSIYRSETLSRLWPHGFAGIGDVTFESAAYVARYVTKKITGDSAAKHYEYLTEDGEIINRVPEFSHMSLKPGIGSAWIDKYVSDIYPEGLMVARGFKSMPPRYYDILYKRKDEYEYEMMRGERSCGSRNYDVPTLDRQEFVALSRQSLMKRNKFYK